MKVIEMDKERQRWLRDGGECGKDGEKVRRVEKWEGLYVGREEGAQHGRKFPFPSRLTVQDGLDCFKRRE
jgi:hypothetical protein